MWYYYLRNPPTRLLLFGDWTLEKKGVFPLENLLLLFFFFSLVAGSLNLCKMYVYVHTGRKWRHPAARWLNLFGGGGDQSVVRCVAAQFHPLNRRQLLHFFLFHKLNENLWRCVGCLPSFLNKNKILLSRNWIDLFYFLRFGLVFSIYIYRSCYTAAACSMY